MERPSAAAFIADGCKIEPEVVIHHSLIGLRAVLGRRVVIRDSVLMGADFLPQRRPGDDQSGGIPMGIGEGTVIEKAIVDKNVCIGKNATIDAPLGFPSDGERGPLVVRDGIIVIPRNTVLPDGWKF